MWPLVRSCERGAQEVQGPLNALIEAGALFRVMMESRVLGGRTSRHPTRPAPLQYYLFGTPSMSIGPTVRVFDTTGSWMSPW
jgi:hypothetical protein